MIRKKKKSGRWEIIDLTGSCGNAFYLLGRAKQYARALDMDVDAVLADMKSGDYEHLLEVFDKHFGEFVILER